MLPWHICGHCPCGSCLWLQRLSVFQVSSLDQDVVDLLLGPCTRSVGRSLSKRFCTSCWVLWNSVSSAIASTNLLFCYPLWMCAVQHWLVRHQAQGLKSALKSPPTICMLFLQELVCFSIVLYIFQCDDRHIPSGGSTRSPAWCFDGWPRSLLWWRHFLFSRIPTPCLWSYFPAPTYMCLWCVSQNSDLASLQISFNNTASHL